MPVAKPQKYRLELASGRIAFEAGSQRQTQQRRLPARTADLAFTPASAWTRPLQIGNGALRVCDGDASCRRDHLRLERPWAVDAQAGSPRSTCLSDYRNVNRPCFDWKQIPKSGRAAVAEANRFARGIGIAATGEHGSHPMTLSGETGVPHRIDTLVHSVQAPGLDPPRDCVGGDSAGL